jgi:hypothetical protein
MLATESHVRSSIRKPSFTEQDEYPSSVLPGEHSTRHAAASETEKSLGSCGGLLKLDFNSEHYCYVPRLVMPCLTSPYLGGLYHSDVARKDYSLGAVVKSRLNRQSTMSRMFKLQAREGL